MSALTTAKTQLKDLKALEKALYAMGWTKEEVEVHQEAKALSTFHGSERAKANIIIRRETLRKVGGNSYNDIGFEQQADGTIRAHIGDYSTGRGGNHGKMKGTWMKQLTQEYALAKLEGELATQNFFLDKVVRKDGKIFITAENPYL